MRKINIPVDVIHKAVEIVKGVSDEYANIDETIRQLPPVSKEMDGKKQSKPERNSLKYVRPQRKGYQRRLSIRF